MTADLWYVLTGSRGGATRATLLAAVADEPMTVGQLAERVDIEYTSARYHLDVLCENDLIEGADEREARTYAPTDEVRREWDVVEDIFEVHGVST